MSDEFDTLPPRLRALVAFSVLLDGREAEVFLRNDSHLGERLAEVAIALAEYGPELRMPLVGTMLREALKSFKG